MRILWVDDEIQGFRPHILLLRQHGAEVDTAERAEEALRALERARYDLVILDYRMPGMDGLELFRRIRARQPNLPVALVTMMTDVEVLEESLVLEAVDYIVKPVQPTQLIALVKKLQTQEVRKRRLGPQFVALYQKLQSFPDTAAGWLEKGNLLLRWMADHFGDREALEPVESELAALNQEFARWVERAFPEALAEEEVLFPHRLLSQEVFPLLREGQRVAVFLFDSMRLDQLYRLLRGFPRGFRFTPRLYMALLPTATLFCRNAFFGGQLPSQIENRYPGWLVDNLHERELLERLLTEKGLHNLPHRLEKVNHLKALMELQTGQTPLEIFVINFLDMVQHLRQEIRALRALLRGKDSVFRMGEFLLAEAGLSEHIARLLSAGYRVFLTSDHGWVEGRDPVIIEGGGELSPGLRFKFGDSVRVRGKGALVVRELGRLGLPPLSTRLALAKGYSYFIYPSAPSKFRKTYAGGIYHGGISLEEMVLPFFQVE